MVPQVLIVDSLDRELEAAVGERGVRARSGSAGELASLAHPAAHQPDVLIIDIRGGRQVPATLPTLKRHHPSLGVVVIASSTESAVLFEAMRAGASEFVAEPIDAAQQGGGGTARPPPGTALGAGEGVGRPPGPPISPPFVASSARPCHNGRRGPDPGAVAVNA